MSFTDVLYTVLIYPLQLLFETLYMLAQSIIGDPGISIIALSLMMNFLVLPLYMRADAMQEHERDMEMKLRDGVAHIKKTFKGDERSMMLQTYYRQNNYKPTDVFKGSISLFLEIPFFISAYMFLSHLQMVQGVSLGIIPDLGAPDGLLKVGDFSINVMPFIMTGINFISCALFTKGMPAKTKIQLYGMALFFLVFLYNSPAGLVFYWTLNNVFALVKTVFYKLKHPKEVLVVLFAIAGIAFIVSGIGQIGILPDDKAAIVIILGVGCVIPGVLALAKKFLPHKQKEKPEPQPNKRVFVFCALFLTVLIGAVIPSAVISSSAQEFVFLTNFYHPLGYVANSLCTAAGFFLVWFSVFYWLCSKSAKVVFERGMVIFCGLAAVNYLLFGLNLGFLSSILQYEQSFLFPNEEMAANVAVTVLLPIALFFLYKYGKKFVPGILAVCTLAFAGMAGMNCVSINDSIDELKPGMEAMREKIPSPALSTEGQNVVVMMLDRAMGEYIPYFINEKPELKEAFDGFTYYSNVISFGQCTIVGSAPLYGGYEYTPSAMNADSSKLLSEKQNDALRVMPVNFDDAGFDVTVCNPTYAGYQWIPDLSIYDDHPNIKAHLLTAEMHSDTPAKLTQKNIDANKRNFFCFAFMKTLPLFAQGTFYDHSNYNNSASKEAPAKYLANKEGKNRYTLEGAGEGWQTATNDGHYAQGLDASFMEDYEILTNLNKITRIEESDRNTFLMLSNDSTHHRTLMQTPDYTPAEFIDNSQYELEHADRFTVNGETLVMIDDNQFGQYETNMATLLCIAKWLDYLKENGVYDNTRIIFVADHGFGADHLKSMHLPYGGNKVEDLENYFPLLLVKDFNSKGFTISHDFMTNADVPSLAFQDLIKNPINPATGKVVNMAEKTAHDQLIYKIPFWETDNNPGSAFAKGGLWLSVHDDMRNLKNWSVVEDQSYLLK